VGAARANPDIGTEDGMAERTGGTASVRMQRGLDATRPQRRVAL